MHTDFAQKPLITEIVFFHNVLSIVPKMAARGPEIFKVNIKRLNSVILATSRQYYGLIITQKACLNSPYKYPN